jgi:hypothetical protein
MTLSLDNAGAPLMASAVGWPDAARVIASEYARDNLFEHIASPGEYDDLRAVADLTNPAIRHAQGELHLIPAEDRVYGPGSGLIMSAFAWPSRGSRFSDGGYGVFYAARTLDTAVAETVYHQTRVLRGMAPTVLEKTALQVTVDQLLVDIRRPHPVAPAVYDPQDYRTAQAFGRTVRQLHAYGIVYHSVRDTPDGECAAIFRPPALRNIHVHQTLEYHWDGQDITVR